MKMNKIYLAASAAIILCGCSTVATAPSAANVSNYDLDALTSSYRLATFDLRECPLVQNSATPQQILSVSEKICSDAENLQFKMEALAAKENVSLPQQLPEDLKARVISLTYHTDTNVNIQYLQDQIASHQDALRILESESSNGHDPAVTALSNEAIPYVQDNLNLLDAALSKLAG